MIANVMISNFVFLGGSCAGHRI